MCHFGFLPDTFKTSGLKFLRFRAPEIVRSFLPSPSLYRQLDMQTNIVDNYVPRPPSPVDRRAGSVLITGRPPEGQHIAYVAPQAFHHLQHEPERGTTTVRTTVEEWGGLVITTTTKIQRLHPDVAAARPTPALGPRSIATVPNSLVVPTAEEEAAGTFMREGNLYVAVDFPSEAEPPTVLALGPDMAITDQARQALSSLPSNDVPTDAIPTAVGVTTPANTSDDISMTETPSIRTNTLDDVESISSEDSVVFTHSEEDVPPVPHPDSFGLPPDNLPAGTRFYVVYVGREVGIYWGDWYQCVEDKVLGVSGFRATKHKTFTQALVEYTRAFYGQKPGYALRIVTDSTTPSNDL
ncbi:hypothetical protein VNI00_016191 [Paramarasmius palmivorus]|uniref:Ribonuclease H1 N-terminal domain-containing protein n=1 Tax=Paramarasmius palmivorus TaxID=297713 RepID=A0AAW0BF05_9AGAR